VVFDQKKIRWSKGWVILSYEKSENVHHLWMFFDVPGLQNRLTVLFFAPKLENDTHERDEVKARINYFQRKNCFGNNGKKKIVLPSQQIFENTNLKKRKTSVQIWSTGPSVFLVVKLNFYLFKAARQMFRKQKCIQKN
jgi:hypothetical protein